MTVRARLDQNLTACLEQIRRVQKGQTATLVAVTKSVEPAVAIEFAKLCAGTAAAPDGVCDLGESRVQEFERKRLAFEAAGVAVRWHFIGHLQSNKARRVVRHAHAVHSVDSLRLLEVIARMAKEENRCPQLFLQIKLNDEASKGGILPAELAMVLGRAGELDLPIQGLMTMAPLEPSAEDGQAGVERARDTFRRLVELGSGLPASAFVGAGPRYSMGMSNDFEIALEEGSDLVRVGSALFRGLPTDAFVARPQPPAPVKGIESASRKESKPS